MLVIRKECDCDNYKIWRQSKGSDWPDFWIIKKKNNNNNEISMNWK